MPLQHPKYRIPTRGTIVVPRSRFSRGVTDSHTLITEASDLRIAPGKWPETIILDGDPDENGSAREGYVFDNASIRNGDLNAVEYRCEAGTPDRLLIFND